DPTRQQRDDCQPITTGSRLLIGKPGDVEVGELRGLEEVLELGGDENSVSHGRRDEAAAGGGERRQKHDGRHKMITHCATDSLFNRMALTNDSSRGRSVTNSCSPYTRPRSPFPNTSSMALRRNRDAPHSPAPRTLSKARRGRAVT